MGTPKHIREPHGEQKENRDLQQQFMIMSRIGIGRIANSVGSELVGSKFITNYCRIVESVLTDKDIILRS